MKRLKMILASIWSSFLGKKEMKYHREILDLSYEQMLDALMDTKRDLADVTTAKHRIMQLVVDGREKSAKLEKDAVRFLESGDETSARDTLSRKALVQEQADTLDLKAASINVRQKELETNIKALETRIEMFKAEKEEIKADYSAAKATAQIGETVTGIQRQGLEAAKAVGRIREATSELTARGDALGELIQGGALEDVFNPGMTPLDRRALEMARDEAVEGDLERLRKQIGRGEPAATGGGNG